MAEELTMTETLENHITFILTTSGADFVRFIDISKLSIEQNRGYTGAILFGIRLTPNYIKEVTETPDYVESRIAKGDNFEDDELSLKEIKTDELSDKIAEYLIDNGYQAFSHSDKSLIHSKIFDGMYGETILPHKTIAVLAGIGWIGKNNLLVTPEFGSALCLGVALTDATLQVSNKKIIHSQCGNCQRCLNICKPHVLTGFTWKKEIEREKIMDVYNCTTCMKCLIHCPFTQRYMKKNINANP